MAHGKNAELIGKLLENIDIAMLTTVGDAGYLVSRPLSTQQASYDGKRVWFFTEGDSPKVAEIARHPKVNLAYASKDKNTYVSVAGDARINRNRRKINELWSDALKAFFPKGKDDPNLVLLEVGVRTVEYWDGPGTLLGKVITFVIARVTGREEVMGENRIVDLTGKRTTTRLPPTHEDSRPSRKPTRGKGPPKVAAKQRRIAKPKAASKRQVAAKQRHVAKPKAASKRPSRRAAAKSTRSRAASARTRTPASKTVASTRARAKSTAKAPRRTTKR